MPPTPNQFLNRIRGPFDAVYFAALGALSIVAFIVLLWHRPSFYCAVGAALIFTLVLTGSRVLFFAILDAAAWNGAQIRYLFPIEPLIALVPVFTFGLAIAGLRRPL